MRISSCQKIEKQAKAAYDRTPLLELSPAQAEELQDATKRREILNAQIDKLREECPGHPHCICAANPRIAELVVEANKFAGVINQYWELTRAPKKEAYEKTKQNLTQARVAKLRYLGKHHEESNPTRGQ